MVSVSWSVDPEGVEPLYGVLRGLPDAGAPLHLLGVVLTDGYSCPQRRWLIDNRMAGEPLSLTDLARFLNITKVHSEKLADVCVAWVAPARWNPLREWLAQQLPFQFRRFKKIDRAQRWLQTQAEG
ncbi:unnamed protein product [marine sediment metagenome]|uniref:Uncharacterized protein n=1 Tax=marine sediment metagenome TaxID=412755 RepID=X0XNU4_9ZZZZ